MAYSFLDAAASIQSADSSVVAGTTQRPIVNIGSVLSAVPVTFSGNTSISGQVGVSVIGLTPVNVVGSVYGTVTLTGNSSISGTVNAITTWTAPSIVGTYSEDATHTTADKGLFVLGVRNDAVASFVSANLEYSPMAADSAGRSIVKPFAPEESRVEGYASVVSTSVTTLVAAAGAGLRNYITDFWLVNSGAATTVVTFKDGAGSILGYSVAPLASGSNSPGIITPIRTGANASFDFQATTATSILFATVKGFKAP